MFDKQLARWSLLKLQIENDTRVLGEDERNNLLDMIDSYIISQGWDLNEFIQEGIEE